MLNDDEIINTLAIVLSIGHAYKYSEEAIMKRIAYSLYFSCIEKNKDDPILYVDEQSLISSIYYDANIASYDSILYNQSLWLSELYVRIQRQTNMTFEGIFLYLPLSKGYRMFPLYHEMDFSQGVDYFLSLLHNQSILSLIMKKKALSIDEVAKASGLSYVMISSLKQRKKDISKVAASNLLAMASYLGVKTETLIK